MIDPAILPDSFVSLAMSAGETWGGAAAMSGLVGIVGGGVAAVAAWALSRHAHRRNHDALRRIAQFATDRAEDAETPRPPIEGEYADVIHAIERAADDTYKRAQEARQKSRACEIELGLAKAELSYLEAILHTISDAVVVTDAFNEVALANPAAAKALDFELDGSAQQPVDRVVRDAQLATLIKDTRDSGDCSRRRRMEKRLPTSDGERVFDVTLASLGDKTPRDPDADQDTPASTRSNGVNGVVTVLRDVTQEREIAESKSHFVSSVSHELRTPLSSIAAYIEMLIDGEAEDPESREEFYRIIQTETTRLARLIDNMLNISRIESGIVRAQRERILLTPIIREALDVMAPQAEAKQMELIDKLSPVQDYVFADRDMMYQVVLNLISNAIKYTEQGGTVTVTSDVDREARTLTFQVADSGVGIPEDALPKLFEKFYRVQDNSKMANGTGLGLNLVKHVVENVHDGTIRVTSKRGEGSTFICELPFAENP